MPAPLAGYLSSMSADGSPAYGHNAAYRGPEEKRRPQKAEDDRGQTDQDAPNIDTHDYEVKVRSIHRFIEEGDKVKVTMRFRGHEMVHQEIGKQVLDRVREEMEATAKSSSSQARRPQMTW